MTATAEAPSLTDLLAVPYGMIPPEPVIPLWPGVIPRRHATIVAAPGGTGKGLWTVDIVARVTTGRPWPGEPADAVREPEAVIMVTPEDDPNEAVAWRLQAAHADTSLVSNLTILPDGSQFMLGDLGKLTDAMAQIEQMTGRKVGLVVLDPLLALTTVKSPGRKEIAPVEYWAREHGPAVIVCHHTVKSGAVAGLKELTNAVRNVLRLGRVAGAEHGSPVREITVEKTNMGSDDLCIRFILWGEGSDVFVAYPIDKQAESADVPAVSRGYTIAPQQQPTPAAEPTASSWQALVCEKGGKPTVIEHDAMDNAAARIACEKHAGHALAWAPGDHGSDYAGTVLKGGMVAAYTVFPSA